MLRTFLGNPDFDFPQQDPPQRQSFLVGQGGEQSRNRSDRTTCATIAAICGHTEAAEAFATQARSESSSDSGVDELDDALCLRA